MIIEIITILSLNVFFYERTSPTCGMMVDGCQVGNEIHLNLFANDLNGALYHEVGHILFNDDFEFIKEYKPLMNMDLSTWYILRQGKDSIMRERASRYFALFCKDQDLFKRKYPELFNHFTNKINEIIN